MCSDSSYPFDPASTGDTTEENVPFRERLRTLWQVANPWPRPPDYEEDKGYIEALARCNAFEPSSPLQAADAKYEYAKSRLEATQKVMADFNERAYRLIQFAGVLLGVLVAWLKAGSQLLDHWWLGVPSLALFALSILQALAAIRAADGAYPPDVADAMELEGETDEWKIRVTSMLDLVVQADYILVNWKAVRVETALSFLVGGVCLVPLLLLA